MSPRRESISSLRIGLELPLTATEMLLRRVPYNTIIIRVTIQRARVRVRCFVVGVRVRV